MSKTPRTITESESQALLDHCQKGKAELLLLLMLDAGLRVGEVVQLVHKDVWAMDGPVHTLYIRPEIAKGKKSRFIPLTARLKAVIATAYRKIPVTNTEQLDLFIFCKGYNDAPYTTRTIQRMINQWSREVISHPITPHVLRHTFGTRIMRIAGIRVAQELLGHKRITSTQIYTHPNSDDLTSAINKLNENNSQANEAKTTF